MKLKSNHYILLISIITLLLLIISSYIVSAQITSTDQAPPGVKWMQINTDDFQLIFPYELENDAKKVAANLENMIEKVSKSIDIKPKKISIILQNHLVEPNGFVQLAPRRSEFFTTAPQQGDSQDWLHSLAIHELRHVAQIDKLTGSLRAPFFEQLAFLFYGLTLPSWFFEGDAVMTETLLTPSGRGRIPSWEMPFRTNLLSDKNYSYQKNYLGSYKDITPGFYELGYFMTGKMQRDYGTKIVDSLMTRMSKNLFRPYNLSRSLRRMTGFNTSQWHTETTNELREKWQNQLNEIQPESHLLYPEANTKTPQNWMLPQRLSDGNIIALYQSPSVVSSLVTIDSTNHQSRLIRIGRQIDPHFSHHANKVVWDEIRTHGRYRKETYNIINIYDLSTKKYTQLTKRSRFFSPTLSPSGDRVASVEIDLSNKVSIVVIDAHSGTEIERFSAPENILLRTPSFHPKGDLLIMVGVSQNGASLVELNLITGKYQTILPHQPQQLERPIYDQNDIIFKAHYNGIDNIYRFIRDSETIYAITNVPYGAFNPSIDYTTNTLLFNEYQVNGHQIGHISLAKNNEKITPKTTDSFISYYKPLLSEETILPTKYTDSLKEWNITTYKEVKNLVNFHSLSFSNGFPTGIDASNTGLYWLSDNLLNTTQIRLGYEYDSNIRSNNIMTSITYQRFLPKISLSYRNTGRSGTLTLKSPNTTDSLVGLRWREHHTALQMDIPLVYYRLNQVYQIGLSTATYYIDRYKLNQENISNQFARHLSFPMSYRTYFNRNNRRSSLDLAPRWGQNLSITYRHLPFDSKRNGEIFSLRSTFYFPGILPNHSFRTRFNYQKGNGTYQGLHDIPMVSGFDHLKPKRIQNTLLTSYQLPIAYPDWSIGSIAYLKRLKGGLFADFQNINKHKPFKPITYGTEIRADVNLLRYYLPIFDVGIKIGMTNEATQTRTPFVTYSIAYNY